MNSFVYVLIREIAMYRINERGKTIDDYTVSKLIGVWEDLDSCRNKAINEIERDWSKVAENEKPYTIINNEGIEKAKIDIRTGMIGRFVFNQEDWDTIVQYKIHRKILN